jgi:hypothetical protein
MPFDKNSPVILHICLPNQVLVPPQDILDIPSHWLAEPQNSHSSISHPTYNPSIFSGDVHARTGQVVHKPRAMRILTLLLMIRWQVISHIRFVLSFIDFLDSTR